MTVRDKFRDDLDFEKFRDVSYGVAVAVVGEGTREDAGVQKQEVSNEDTRRLLTSIDK